MDEHVGVDSPVQFVDAFVAKLYLPDAGFLRVAPRRTQRRSGPSGEALHQYKSAKQVIAFDRLLRPPSSRFVRKG